MRELVRDRDRLEHIVEAIDRILGNTDFKSRDELDADNLRYYGIVKSIEIIGEAAYQLTNEFRDSHPQTPWKVIINMRHVLVHGYADIVPSVLWKTLKDDLLPLKEQLVDYMDNMT